MDLMTLKIQEHNCNISGIVQDQLISTLHFVTMKDLSRQLISSPRIGLTSDGFITLIIQFQ